MLSLRASLHRSANRLSAGYSRQAFHGYILPYQQHYGRARRQCLHTDSFLQGNTADYLDDMYAAWREDPSSVDASWKTYFEAIENGKQPPERIFYPSEETSFGRGSGRSSMLPGLNIATQGPFSPSPLNDDQAKIQRLIRAFQDYGHLKAKTNPLDLPGKRSMSLPELQPNFYGFTEVDLDRRFALGPEVLPHFATNEGQFMALREIIKSCETVYCSSIGAEYSHLSTREEREWVRQAIECPEPYRFSTLSKSILTVCNIIIIGIAFAMCGMGLYVSGRSINEGSGSSSWSCANNV